MSGAAALLAQQRVAAPSEQVEIEFRLIDWSYSDFVESFPLHATLGDVKRRLVEKHGRLASLDLFRDSPVPERALPRDAQHEAATLRALGFGEALSAAGRPRRQLLFYSFVPHDATNPTLLAAYVRGRGGADAGAL